MANFNTLVVEKTDIARAGICILPYSPHTAAVKDNLQIKKTFSPSRDLSSRIPAVANRRDVLCTSNIAPVRCSSRRFSQ